MASEDVFLMTWARRLWAGWKVVAEKIGVVESRLILVLLYFFVVTPFALVVKMAEDPLRMKRPEASNWSPRRANLADPEWAKRQF